MSKISGESGLAKIGSAVNISSATFDTDTATINFSSAHGLTTGQRVLIEDVEGATELNGFHTVTVSDSDTITVALSSMTAYTTGGTAIRIIDITGWDMEESIEVADVTDSSNTGFAENISKGFKKFSGSFEGFLHTSVKQPDSGDNLSLTLEIDGTNYFSGSVILSSKNASLQIAGTEAVKVGYSFTGSGTLSHTAS